MSDVIISSLVTGATGLIGVGIGLLSIMLIQAHKDKKEGIKSKQVFIIEKLEDIQKCIDSIRFIFQAIDDFIFADFKEPEDWYENTEAIIFAITVAYGRLTAAQRARNG